MPRLTHKILRSRKHVKGAAFVELQRRQIGLARFDDAETRRWYDRPIGE
ncbi:MAG: hypothetical protein PVI86_12875 [Phycisphaerae bacterium]|jgi:hypothetical protein